VQDISLHILDIAENSITAGATRIEISVTKDTQHEILTLVIRDNGIGMDPEIKTKALDPFFTTRRGKKVGLGIPLLAQAARESGGDIRIESRKGAGTTITARFMISHPDRKPLGDIGKTVYLLRATHPEIQIEFPDKKMA
jgi:signal transduction histidine kinase